MKQLTQILRAVVFAVIGLSSIGAGQALAQSQHTLLGVDCAAPPLWHCPDSDCPSSVVTQAGATVEMKTRRPFFLDCPSDYKPGDKVNILLSLHGAGSFANWQRNYFPAMDVKDKYKLVIITPEFAHSRLERGRRRVPAQHRRSGGGNGRQGQCRPLHPGRPNSRGARATNRIICTDYFKDKVDVRISLSGGRNRCGDAGRTGLRRRRDRPSTRARRQRPIRRPDLSASPPQVNAGPPGGAMRLFLHLLQRRKRVHSGGDLAPGRQVCLRSARAASRRDRPQGRLCVGFQHARIGRQMVGAIIRSPARALVYRIPQLPRRPCGG